MNITKLNRLFQYLSSLEFINSGEITRIADQKVGIVKSWGVHSDAGLFGTLNAIQSYSGYIHIDGFSENQFTESELLVMINLWLQINDYFYSPIFNRKQDQFPIGIKIRNPPKGDSTSFLEIEVLFHELIVLIEDSNGNIPIDAKKFRIADSAILAENFEKDFLS